ncbi:MAG TPA: hypothetical protein VFL90_05585, partial [Methylomirabilota bacterium]|nr:hypothetical protein [Methylomirabilota bacterium]
MARKMDLGGGMHSTTHARVRCPVPALALLVLALVVAALAGPAQAQVNLTGSWQLQTPTVPINPIHAALLHTGKVLI